MVRASRVWLLVACVIGLLGSLAWHPGGEAWAQTPAVLAGAYKARFVKVGVREWPREQVDQLPELHLLPNNRFIYGPGDSGHHGDYRVLAGGRVELGSCIGWKADITQPPNRELYFRMTDAKGAMAQEMRMERLGAPRPPSPEPPYNPDCKFAMTTGRTTTASQEPVISQETSRIIDGDIFLAVKQGALPGDLDLWTCLVSGGYPGLEYREDGSSTSPQRLLVLLDGRFRTRVRGGVIYRWWMLPAGCPTPPRQPEMGIGTPGGPMEPWVNGEKILLACFVSGGRLPDCQGWWLRKP